MGGTCAEFSSVRKFGSAKKSRSFDPASLAVWLAGLLGSVGCCALGACPDDGAAFGAVDCGCCAGGCCCDCGWPAGGGPARGRAHPRGALGSKAGPSHGEKAKKG